MQQLKARPTGVAHLPSLPQDADPLARPARRPEAKRRRLPDGPCMTHDVWIYRIVVTSFAAVLILTAVGALMLAFTGQDLPQTASTLFIALTSGAVGALAGLLAPSPRG
jgi:hypothetical protein